MISINSKEQMFKGIGTDMERLGLMDFDNPVKR
ncbi:Uncharacterised protein [Legionella waltersii]|nr:Uncharacterised protein [Legionella waltersii]